MKRERKGTEMKQPRPTFRLSFPVARLELAPDKYCIQNLLIMKWTRCPKIHRNAGVAYTLRLAFSCLSSML